MPIDDQPIDAGFFSTGAWLSEYVTPDNPDVEKLYEEITSGVISRSDRTVACWDWVANKVKYRSFIRASITIEGTRSIQNDFWQTPAMVIKTKIGNCANKAFLLTSLLRNEFPSNQIYTVLGNLHEERIAGHAWVQVLINGTEYIVESTRNDVPMVVASLAKRYEPVHYFNDEVVLAVPNRTVMVPFEAKYSNWLGEYLNWGYINGG